MKKHLLFASLLCSVFTVATAQTEVSFETTEGFTLGALQGQNSWTPVFPDSDISTITIDDVRATDGTYSLQFDSDDSMELTGVLSPQLPSYGSAFEVSFDFYPESDEDSDYHFYSLQSAELTYASYLLFEYTGNIKARIGTTAAQTVGTYTAGQWYNVNVKFDYAAGTVTYFVNDVQVLTGPTMGTSTGVDKLFFGYDNFGSGMSVDNIVVEQTSLGRDSFNAASLSFYPNPTSSILNIVNSENTILESVVIADINGRIIKTIEADALSSGKINISEFSNGVYMMTIATDKGTLTKKIVKN